MNTPTSTPDFKLAYGFHRLLPTDDTIAGYGARLIYSEVRDGGRGVVWDRQDAFGPKELVEGELFPVLDRWYEAVRRLDSGSDDVVMVGADTAHGHVIVSGGPQRSYGYLYVTALLNPPAKEA